MPQEIMDGLNVQLVQAGEIAGPDIPQFLD
jgi:hypothetical protein